MSRLSRFRLKRDASREKEFWDWFASHSSQFMELEENQESLFDQLQERLARIHPDLTFEFSSRKPFGREFILSAGGVKEAFPAVLRLVEAAPELPGWTVIPFRPRRETDFILDFGGLRLAREDLWFQIEPDGKQVGLHLYITGFDEEIEDNPFVGASFLFLDNALGEYDVETKLGFIERYPLPSHPETLGLRPFSELPDAVDRMYQDLNHVLPN